MQATIRRGNRTARRFVERLGFRYEGMAREAWPTGEDAALYSMLRRECRWTGDRHGKESPRTAPRTRDPAALVAAQARANRISQFTPQGNLLYGQGER